MFFRRSESAEQFYSTLCTPPVDSLSDDPSAWALESLVASPECEPGLEVPIDCEEDDLPHLPGWVRKSMVKYVSPTGLWMDTPTRSAATARSHARTHAYSNSSLLMSSERKRLVQSPESPETESSRTHGNVLSVG